MPLPAHYNAPISSLDSHSAKVDGLRNLLLAFADALGLAALEPLQPELGALRLTLRSHEGHHRGVLGHDALLRKNGIRFIRVKRLQILQGTRTQYGKRLCETFVKLVTGHASLGWTRVHFYYVTGAPAVAGPLKFKIVVCTAVHVALRAVAVGVCTPR